ncbi:MAG: beta-ketoacyl-[acyl-carrier-protein] synthase family protein [Paludibacteraceae bacterium]|nr:beta-ketoacyl-[acyl-carrier-protein] synthase family protein [Paludibacteraceae bacterium]
MRIAITGCGVVSAIGEGVKETEVSLRNERCGIGLAVFPGIGEQMVGKVNVDNEMLAKGLGIEGEMPRSVLLGIKAAREALSMARVEDVSGMGFVNGTTVGGMDLTERHYDQIDKYKSLHLAETCSELIAKNTGVGGKTVTISTACSSALNSIITASEMIRAGRVSRVMAGGTECLTMFHQLGFMSLGIVDKERCRPFDAGRNGLNLGEGAAYIVIETEESAKERKAEILGYVAGYGNACDAYHQTATSENGEGACMAMLKALRMAGVETENIDYINAHGTSTLDNDRSESVAIKRVFGEKPPMVSSTKGFTGHTTSASGAIETVISLVAMRNGFVPGNMNWGKSEEEMIEPVAHTMTRSVERVMCNSFGFGGNDSSVIITMYPGRELEPIRETAVKEVVCVEKKEGDDCGKWIKPIEARRMTMQMRLVTVAACEALEKAGLEKPDAIITTTSLGMISNSMRILDGIENGEEVKPSLFMLSTHNSISSMLAIRFGCHGYNCTYCSSGDAVEDAERLISEGEARYVMLVEYEENEKIWQYRAKTKVKIITGQ